MAGLGTADDILPFCHVITRMRRKSLNDQQTGGRAPPAGSDPNWDGEAGAAVSVYTTRKRKADMEFTLAEAESIDLAKKAVAEMLTVSLDKTSRH